MNDKLSGALRHLAACLAQPAEDWRPAEISAGLKAVTDAVKDARSAGGASLGEARETLRQMEQLRKDVDHLAEDVREAKRARLNLWASRPNPLDKSGRGGFEFSEPDLAAAFGSFCLKLYSRDVKDMTPVAGSEGGWLIPEPELQRELARMVASAGVAARLGRRVPMGPGGFGWGRRAEGAIAYWKAAGQAGTKSSPTFGRGEMLPETLIALIDVDIELVEDALIDVGNFLATEFAWAMADKEDQAALIGDGSPTYGGITGILNSDRVTIVDQTYQSHKARTWHDGLTETEAAVMDSAVGAGTWLMHRTVKATLKRFAVTTTGATAALWQPAIAGEPSTVMGHPHAVSRHMPKYADIGAGTKYLIFGDFRRGLYIGRRRELAIDFSDAAGWANLQRCWRAYERADIAVNGFTAAEITLHPELENPLAVLRTKPAS